MWRAEEQSGITTKKKYFAPQEIDVDNMCQWQNGLIQMDHITLHISHVKLWQFLFVFKPLR